MNDDTAVGAGSPRPSPHCISHKRGIAETWRNALQVPIYRPANPYPGEFFKTHKEYLVYQQPLREKTAMSNFIERLYTSDEPAIRYKTRVYLFDENPATPDAQELQDAIKTSERVHCLLAGRDEHGRLPSHPYSKWYGAHWVLVALADLDYPPGDETLLPLREQVYEWLFSDSRRRSIKQYTIAGRTRMCASMEGNACFALLKLGLADERIDSLVERLLAWQWPDGGWNCDKKSQTHVSSFTNPGLKAPDFRHGDEKPAARPRRDNLTTLQITPRMWTCVKCFSIASIPPGSRFTHSTRPLMSVVGCIITCWKSASMLTRTQEKVSLVMSNHRPI